MANNSNSTQRDAVGSNALVQGDNAIVRNSRQECCIESEATARPDLGEANALIAENRINGGTKQVHAKLTDHQGRALRVTVVGTDFVRWR